MRFIKVVGLALLASLAIGMVASASASAELGIFECTEGTVATGLGSNCLAGGASEKFTVKPITGATFTSKAVGNTVLATSSKTITCTGATNEGVITSLTEDRATIKFTGCTANGGVNCQSLTGASAKEIVAPVSSKIVSILNSNNELKAGLLLAPRNASNVNEVEFECGGVKVKVYGSVIGAVEPEDVSAKSLTVKLTVTNGVQGIPETTNSLRAKFGSGATEKATQEGTALLDFTLNVEVMG
jgi:hypothetical protein